MAFRLSKLVSAFSVFLSPSGVVVDSLAFSVWVFSRIAKLAALTVTRVTYVWIHVSISLPRP